MEIIKTTGVSNAAASATAAAAADGGAEDLVIMRLVVGPAGDDVYRLNDAHLNDDFDPLHFLDGDNQVLTAEQIRMLDEGGFSKDDARQSLTPQQRPLIQKEKERREGLREKVRNERDNIAAVLAAAGFIVGVPDRIEKSGCFHSAFAAYVVVPPSRAAAVKEFMAMCGAYCVWKRDWSGPATPDELYEVGRRPLLWQDTACKPQDGETAGEYTRRMMVDPDRFAKLAELWRVCGGNPTLFRKQLAFHCPPVENEAAAFIVPGLIPEGKVVLFVGEKKAGKTTSMIALGVTVANGGGKWCGFDVPTGGSVALVLGEDDGGDVSRNIRAMTGGLIPPRLFPFCKDGRPLVEIIREICSIPDLKLVVIDPARKYLDGDEDASGAVSEFFSELETLSARGITVIVIHHPRKGGNFRTLSEVYNAARGSGVFLDRPRVAIAMVLKGGRTILGIPRLDGRSMHNMPPAYGMFEGEVELIRDAATLRLVSESEVANGHTTARSPAGTEAEERVLAALRRLVASGETVRRTGQHGLYKLAPLELAGRTRAAIEAAVAALIARGDVIDGPGGLRAVRPAPIPAFPETAWERGNGPGTAA